MVHYAGGGGEGAATAARGQELSLRVDSVQGGAALAGAAVADKGDAMALRRHAAAAAAAAAAESAKGSAFVHKTVHCACLEARCRGVLLT